MSCPSRTIEKSYLGDDGNKFPTGAGDSMCGRVVARG